VEKRFVLPSTRGKVLPMSTSGIHARVIVEHRNDGTTVSEDMPLEEAEELARRIESSTNYNEVRVSLERA